MIETSCYRHVIDKAVGLKPTLQRYAGAALRLRLKALQ
jgi:hypothetical protein